MSNDKYYQRLEALFSDLEPAQPASAPEALPAAEAAAPRVVKVRVADATPADEHGAEAGDLPAPEASRQQPASGPEAVRDEASVAPHSSAGERSEPPGLDDRARTDLTRHSYTLRYALCGAAFGFLFPVFSTAIVLLTRGLSWSLPGLLQAQRTEPLLWVIDTAPFFLGLVAALAGRREDYRRTAYAFLRDLTDSLEARVEARTRDLQVAAEVSWSLSQVRDLDALLANAVEIIRGRFDLYYVQLYLPDSTGRALVLRAGTGAVGAELLRRVHRLPLDLGSINGTAAVEKRAVIVADTAASAAFRPNALLPDTRSEMAIPMMAEDRVVGVLDLHSAQPGALTHDSLPIFEALAGQLAIAIENAALLAETEQARAEVEAYSQRLTRTGWQDFLDAVERSERIGYAYDLAGVAPLAEPLPSGADAEPHILSTPIVVGGEPVGALRLEGEADRAWTDDEAELATSVARQVAQQVENLRLLAEADQARAEAEQATRRLTRRAWEGYLETSTANAGYAYDLDRVTPLTGEMRSDDPGKAAVTRALTVHGEQIGELAVLPGHGLGRETAELVAAVAERLSAHIENLRLAEQTQAALVENQRQRNTLQTILDNLPVGVVVADARTGQPLLVNRAGVELLGHGVDPKREADEVYPAFVPGTDLPFPPQDLPLARTLASGDLERAELDLVRPDHSRLTLDVIAAPIRDEADRTVSALALFQDITERKQAEETLRQQNAYLAALQETTLGLVGRLELTDLLENLITRAGALLGTPHAYLFLLEPGADEMQMQVGVGVYSPYVGYRLKRGAAVVGTVWESGEPLVVDDYRAWARRLNLAQLEPVRAVVGVPLKSGSEVVGVIGLAHLDEARRFDQEEVAVLSRFAELAAVALDNARLYAAAQSELAERRRAEEALGKRAAELETVAKVSTAASTLLDAQELLQSVVDLAKISFGLYHAHLYRLDEAGENLVLSAGAGEVGRRMVAEGRSIPLAHRQSLVARAARTRQAVVVNDVHSAPDFLPHPLLPDTRAEMAVPMIVGDRVLGVFDVQSDRLNAFSDEDVRIQTTLAAQVAVALQNADLYTEQAATVARLRELDQLKSSFLANMSHELRTPLNSILGFTDVILEGLDGPVTELMESDLKVVRNNGQHLLNLINDVLDMAKIEAGRMNLMPERFNLQEVLAEVMEITHPLAREKALDLRLEASDWNELELEADRVRLRQVMLNLVNNAIKFTDAGHIAIRAGRENGAIRIRVRDTGLGIPQDQFESIFQEFHQVDTSTTRKVGGTGLGLPISRHLIEMHGGRLWVESRGVPGEGSTFHVELPVESRIAAENM